MKSGSLQTLHATGIPCWLLFGGAGFCALIAAGILSEGGSLQEAATGLLLTLLMGAAALWLKPRRTRIDLDREQSRIRVRQHILPGISLKRSIPCDTNSQVIYTRSSRKMGLFSRLERGGSISLLHQGQHHPICRNEDSDAECRRVRDWLREQLRA